MSLHKAINIFIASVWIINGLVCKVLNFVPRHQEIVSRILGNEYAVFLTKFIGLLEIGMAIWILSGFSRRLNVFMQILIVLTMNTLEFILVPDLLLWGRFNLVFAILFCVLIFCNEFYLRKPVAQQV